jgi:hypothetical protein
MGAAFSATPASTSADFSSSGERPIKDFMGAYIVDLVADFRKENLTQRHRATEFGYRRTPEGTPARKARQKKQIRVLSA